MNDPSYWKRYVLELNADELARRLEVVPVPGARDSLELLHLAADRGAPCVVISPGSGGHAYVFAELGYRIHAHGFNVFIMPKQGGRTISKLVDRHELALHHIASRWNDRIGVFAEGLGGFVAFYLALRGAPVRSAIYQNAPALLDEPAFRDAVLSGRSSRRRKALLPVARALARLRPTTMMPIRSYLDFREMVDPVEPAHAIEARLVDAYERDPDFDRRYPIAAILSLLDTPPPRPLAALRIPTMFVVPSRGFAPGYVRALFERLPPIDKQLVDVDGSVFWMCSHPRDAAQLICDRFRETIAAATAA